MYVGVSVCVCVLVSLAIRRVSGSCSLRYPQLYYYLVDSLYFQIPMQSQNDRYTYARVKCGTITMSYELFIRRATVVCTTPEGH
jgi:hypothetical protein